MNVAITRTTKALKACEPTALRELVVHAIDASRELKSSPSAYTSVPTEDLVALLDALALVSLSAASGVRRTR
jgi:hypothetical protein